MGKYFKFLLLAMLVVGMMAGTAFAGTTTVNAGAAGANFLASLETTGAARNVTVTGPGAGNTVVTAPIAYTAGQALTSGNLLTVTFTNAGFTGAALNICAGNAPNADQLVANATPTAGATNMNFQLDIPAGMTLGAGNFVYLTSVACGTGNVPVQIAATTSATTATVKVDAITAGGISIDTSTADLLATIQPEYTVANADSAHTIDYLGTPGDGTRVISGGAAANVIVDSSVGGAVNVASITRTANDYTCNSAGQNAALTVAAVLSLTDSADWQGVSRVYLMPNNTACAIAANVVANTAPSGTVALTIPTTGASNFNGTATSSYNLCVEVDGTTSLQTRTLQASVDVGVTGTGANDPGAAAADDAQVWGLNAYQAVIPWMVTSSSVPTYCLINNADASRTASVLVDVISSEGGIVVENLNLGSIDPETSNMAVFSVDSASLTGGTPASLTTLGDNQRYAPRITVTANPANVTMTCIQTDPISGSKRAVPVLTGAGATWKQ
jgi:hypothetical protein